MPGFPGLWKHCQPGDFGGMKVKIGGGSGTERTAWMSRDRIAEHQIAAALELVVLGEGDMLICDQCMCLARTAVFHKDQVSCTECMAQSRPS